MSYYFLTASLPELRMGDLPGITFAEFEDACSRHLTGSHFDALAALDVTSEVPPGAPEYVRRWHDAENQMRNTVARARSARIGREPGKAARSTRDYDVFMDKVISDAFQNASPRERERALDAYRWEKSDALAGRDPFSIDAILAYAIRLRIAHRWAAMDEEQGKARARAFAEQEAAK
jgi:hypothetical protein